MSMHRLVLIMGSVCIFSSAKAQEVVVFVPFLKEFNISQAMNPKIYLESWWWPWSGKENDKKERDQLENEKKENEIKEIEQAEKKIEKDPNPFLSENLVDLEKTLQERIIGQNQAIQMTVAALERYAYGLNDLYAPIASLLYMGPSGVGKTQLAKELARALLGNEQNLIRLNMAEYADKHTLSRLIGAPQGYLDHEKGGQLTEALKKNPYAIVLLDEIEKADPVVQKVFLQLFDEGFITDSAGKVIDCRNMLFILTTNLEGQKILTMHDLGHGDQEILSAVEPALMTSLSPELYNRLETVIFRGLKVDVLDKLTYQLLLQATEELYTKRQISIDFDQSVIEFVKNRSSNYQLGARPFKHLIKQTVMTAITDAIKQRYLKKGDQAGICFQESHLIIHKSEEEQPFTWYWKEEKQEIKPPFKLGDLLNLENKLQQKVLGQPYAIQMTVAALMRYSAGLLNKKSPIGSFLYVGPTGVGKTQLAKELAVELMGSEQHLIRLDMSEYSEQHSISRLIGSPPGYINHEEGGQLTEALKKHPYAIVLLDEIEKAHPIVLKTFLQVFDEGRLSDTKGVVIDCRNVIFIATTNLASATILNMHQQGYQEEEILEFIQNDITKFLSPELYNRLEVALFRGLSPELLDQLIYNMLKEVQDDLYAKKGIEIQFDSSLIDFLKIHGYDYELGARPLKRLIQQTVMTSLAKAIIAGTIQSGDVVMLSYSDGQLIMEKPKQINVD